MGKPTELMQLLKTGNSDAARKLIAKMKKSGKYRAAIEQAALFKCYLVLMHVNRLVYPFAGVYKLSDRVRI